MFRHVDVHLHDFMRFSEVKNTGPTVLTGGLIARYEGGGECIHPAHPPTSMRKENIISITASRGGKAARSSHHLERFLASFWSCSPCEEVSVWSLSHAGAKVLTRSLKSEITAELPQGQGLSSGNASLLEIPIRSTGFPTSGPLICICFLPLPV